MKQATHRADLALVDGALGRIKVIRHSLHQAERRVADTVLASPERIIHMPIAELAEAAGVSEGTVVRFCQSVGCRGYQSLKLALAADLSQPTAVLHSEVEPDDALRPDVVGRKVFASNIRSIEETLRILDGEALSRVVDAVVSARRVAFFAIGASSPIAFDAAGRFLRIGVTVDYSPDAFFQAMTASLLGEGDVAVAISHSGASQGPVACLELARECGALTVAITGRHPSPVSTQADIVLLTVSSETAYREEAMASRLAQLSLLDTIYVCTALRVPDLAVRTLRRTSEAIATQRIR